MPREIVEIAQEADPRGIIEGRQWRDALILGPAVLLPLENVTITASTFDGDADSVFFEIGEKRSVVGPIGLRNVTFDRCRFQNIGLAGTREGIARMRKGFFGK